ncbi:hypothetical protein F66182_10148 [Fusarium sp. NRRL 66182]|nr:hypothetical protein F66182_10148 [Fusarium sp. NRRL 66182]
MDSGPAREDSKFMEPMAPQLSSFLLSDDEAMQDAEYGREEEWDESLFQSDPDRLEGLMASRAGLSAAAARSASTTRKTLMRVNLRADAPLIMDKKKCWENLFLEDYGNIWGFNQRETAKSRFDRVLTYIRTGQLPADAKLGMYLLRRSLRDSFMGRDGGKELNPDLSSRWVQEFLENLFMALVTQEAQKDDAQPVSSADKSELPIQQSSAPVPSHGTAGQDAEGDAELEQHSTCTSWVRKRPADETSPLPRSKHKRKKRHCRDAEDDMLQSDAKIPMRPDFESGHPEWSHSDLSHLRTIVSSGEHIPTAVKSWVEQTGSKRTRDAMVACLKLNVTETAVLWIDEEDAALMTACEGLDKTRPMTEAFKAATETKRTEKDTIQRTEYVGLNLGHRNNPKCENHPSSSFQGLQKRWASKEDKFLESLRDGYNDASRYQTWKKEYDPTRTLTGLKLDLFVRLNIPVESFIDGYWKKTITCAPILT